MDRRSLFLGVGCSLISSTLKAKTQMIGPITQVFVASPTRIEQHCPEWCWAASTAMIFAINGHPTDQEAIIQRVFNGMVCTTGNSSVMTKLLSDEWVDNNQIVFKSKVVAAYDIFNNIVAIDNNIIVNELAADRPLLYANKQHAMVVVSAKYYQTPMGPNVLEVGVLDPWPYNPAYHLLSYKEMVAAHKGGDYSYLAAVRIT